MNIENKYLIVWQKWFDPFGEDEETHDYTDYAGDQYEDTSEFQPKTFKAISTPMGIIPYTENTASSKIFNFWVGHTNFDITTHISSIIEQTKGVETLDVFTRYRFRIGIGKIFDESEVKSSITKTTYEYLNDNKTK